MAIEMPEWMKPNFVNVENLMIDIFTKVFPDITSGCWTPDDWLESQIEPAPLIQFFRLPGGQVNWVQRKDQCLVQALVMTGSRDDSWRVMDGIRSVLLPWDGDKFKMSDGYTAQMWCADEAGGPQLLTPGQQIDVRVVAAVFKVTVGMKTAKDYRAQIAALSAA